MVKVSRYHPLLVALHWTTAVLALGALALGLLIVWQLYSRRGEALDREHLVQRGARQPTMVGAAGTP
jgi:cytochrome b561